MKYLIGLMMIAIASCNGESGCDGCADDAVSPKYVIKIDEKAFKDSVKIWKAKQAILKLKNK